MCILFFIVCTVEGFRNIWSNIFSCIRRAESLSAMQALQEKCSKYFIDLNVNLSGTNFFSSNSYNLLTVWFVLGTVDLNVTTQGSPLKLLTELNVCTKSTLGIMKGSYTSQSQPRDSCLLMWLFQFFCNSCFYILLVTENVLCTLARFSYYASLF